MKLILGLLVCNSVLGFQPIGPRSLHRVRTPVTALADLHQPVSDLLSHIHTHGMLLADGDASAVAGDVSRYATVDKSGVIGFFADKIEKAIDLGHQVIPGKNTYGFSIIIFTILIKAATLPLTMTQLESTTKMQKLTPLQKKIQDRFSSPEDEQKKNQLMAQLFQAANVNPLAGCLPAIVQIPVFISLYRALQNLVAENKLAEPFLWVPDLEVLFIPHSFACAFQKYKLTVSNAHFLLFSFIFFFFFFFFFFSFFPFFRDRVLYIHLLRVSHSTGLSPWSLGILSSAGKPPLLLWCFQCYSTFLKASRRKFSSPQRTQTDS
jgi:YidC/Oxa1 family membrane protein insertase